MPAANTIVCGLEMSIFKNPKSVLDEEVGLHRDIFLNPLRLRL
jgi:hypothetical protein